MAFVNDNYCNLKDSYLFSQIAQKVNAYVAEHPEKKVIRMGIGDVTLPLAPAVIDAMQKAVAEMGVKETFRGYGPEQGYDFLHAAIVKYYAGFGVTLASDEIFISDGAKSDCGNITDIFSNANTILIPDPVYPVYLDTNIMCGRKIVYMDGKPENNFLPMPDDSVKADIIYLCSPNNPTGAVYTKEQLEAWVAYALKNDAVILYDAAYEAFVDDPAIPRSIFVVEDARKCAIELCSLSKTAGFTGTRCGYTVVPHALVRKTESGKELELNKMWLRRQTTKFNAVLPAERTTPDALTLQRLLREMADAGCTHVVMEVSSHALVQRRAGAIDFALGVFTNLTQDHLDYHGTMEAYCDAKARLFRQCRAAAVNGDDPWTPRLLENVTCPVTRFGQGLANDLVGWDAHYCADRVSFTACSDSEHIPVTLHIPGAFSLYNALAALAAAQALGIPIEDAAQALSLCQGVRGRAEVVPTDTDYTVLIDYAHTPDGLKNILSTVCGFADARVLIVFGCGGDRDRTKRAEMGRIAARLADEVIVTSDNPRTENPYAILHDSQALSQGREWEEAYTWV